MPECNTTADALNKTVDAGIQGVQKLTEAVEKIAPDAWNVLVRQQILDGWVNIIICTLWGLTVPLFLILGKKFLWNNKDWAQQYEYQKLLWTLIISGILFTFNLILWCNYGADGVKKIYNPQYYAALQIINSVK